MGSGVGRCLEVAATPHLPLPLPHSPPPFTARPHSGPCSVNFGVGLEITTPRVSETMMFFLHKKNEASHDHPASEELNSLSGASCLATDCARELSLLASHWLD